MMKTMQRRKTGLKIVPTVLLAVVTSMTSWIPTASAGHGAAWGLGGLLAGGMLTKAYEDKKQKESYYAPPPQHSTTYVVSSPASTTMTPEQKIQQLNKLAAGGYITPQEYKTEKQAILNSIVE